MLEGVLVEVLLVFEALDELFGFSLSLFEPSLMFFKEVITPREFLLDCLELLLDEIFVDRL